MIYRAYMYTCIFDILYTYIVRRQRKLRLIIPSLVLTMLYYPTNVT